MSQSKITLIGFNNYLANNENDNLFSKMVLPEGINKDIVCDNILLRGGEFETLIANPFVLRDAIGVWSYKWQWTFDRWLKAINIEYNPLENYNRTETYTDIENGSNSNTSNNTTANSNTGTTTDTSAGSGSVENTKSAYNSDEYEPNDKSESTNTTNATTTVNSNSSGTNDTTDSGTYDKNITHNAHISGNIGVTTSQQMLQSEIDVAMFNLYDRIADLFLQEFVIPIY